MSAGTFDIVLSDEGERVTLPLAMVSITMHADASMFVGALEELATVPGVRFSAEVGPGYNAVGAKLGDDLTVTIFVPAELRPDEDARPSERLAAVRALIPEVTS